MDDIREIIKNNRLSDFIKQTVSLEKKGNEWIGCCPFHKEKTPSFFVNDEKGLFNCFGCGESGDIFNFVLNTQNCDFKEAMKNLCVFYGISYQEKNSYKEYIFEKAQEFFQDKKDDFLFKKFCQDRKIKEKTAGEFGLGWTGENSFGLTQFLSSASDKKAGEKKGLLIRKSKETNLFDFFRKRIIFPFQSKSGNIIGFSSRLLEKKEGVAKYLHLRGTRKDFLYGEYQAKNFIYEKKRMILVEGLMDVVRMHQEGFKETVAILGTGLKLEILQYLKKQNSKVYFLLDGDPAGKVSSLRIAKDCLKQGLDSFFCFLIAGLDPDSFFDFYNDRAKETMEELLKKSASAEDLVFQTELEKIKEIKSIIEKEKSIKNFIAWIESVPDLVRKNLLKERLEKELRIKIEKKKIQPQRMQEKRVSHTFYFLVFLFCFPSRINILKNLIGEQKIVNQKYTEIFSRLLKIEPQDLEIANLNSLISLFDGEETHQLLIAYCRKFIEKNEQEIKRWDWYLLLYYFALENNIKLPEEYRLKRNYHNE